MTLRPCIFLCLGLAAGSVAAGGAARIIVQDSPLAGFRYYEGKAVWDEMRVGDLLVLARERDNPHDANAVRVEWKGRTLGYLPRRENVNVARQLDHGAAVSGRITGLRRHRNGRHAVRYEVSVPLAAPANH